MTITLQSKRAIRRSYFTTPLLTSTNAKRWWTFLGLKMRTVPTCSKKQWRNLVAVILVFPLREKSVMCERVNGLKCVSHTQCMRPESPAIEGGRCSSVTAFFIHIFAK